VFEGRVIPVWEALTRAFGSERIYLVYNRAKLVFLSCEDNALAAYVLQHTVRLGVCMGYYDRKGEYQSFPLQMTNYPATCLLRLYFGPRTPELASRCPWHLDIYMLPRPTPATWSMPVTWGLRLSTPDISIRACHLGERLLPRCTPAT
jgi:hypothetical protein